MLFLYVTYSNRLVVWNSDFFLGKIHKSQGDLEDLEILGV